MRRSSRARKVVFCSTSLARETTSEQQGAKSHFLQCKSSTGNCVRAAGREKSSSVVQVERERERESLADLSEGPIFIVKKCITTAVHVCQALLSLISA